jgi:hypothetical protein
MLTIQHHAYHRFFFSAGRGRQRPKEDDGEQLPRGVTGQEKINQKSNNGLQTKFSHAIRVTPDEWPSPSKNN